MNIAMMMAKKKKMAQGGHVEKINLEHSDLHHFGNEHDAMPEPKEHNLHGKGFSESEIDGHEEKYDYEPHKFAKGGICYAEGGEAHPLDMMYRKKFLEAKKMAYGGDIKPADEETLGHSYPEHDEENTQLEHMREGLTGPAQHTAKDEDEARLAFARSFMMKRAMRK